MIKFKDNSFQAVPDESVLECLLRNGEFVPNGCRSGICHSCLMRATQGNPSAESQKGLKPTQIEKNMPIQNIKLRSIRIKRIFLNCILVIIQIDGS